MRCSSSPPPYSGSTCPCRRRRRRRSGSPGRTLRHRSGSPSLSPSLQADWLEEPTCDDRRVSQAVISQSRAALRAGDATTARQLLAKVPDGETRGDVLELLARASYLDLDFQTAIEGWERAYACFRASGDRAGAMRVARTLSGQYGVV